MPVYEFYCAGCHTVFNFLSRTPNTDKRPSCPRCGRPRLERRLSRFAISKSRPEAEEPYGDPDDMEDPRLEQVFAEMAAEADGLDENDPRAMARWMRRFTEATGQHLGEGMEEAIRRLEAGEDPEAIEESLGDLSAGEEPLPQPGTPAQHWIRRLRPPDVDDTLYDM